MYQDMEVYYIILLCLVTEIVSQDPDNLLSEEKAICGNRYYFLNERYTYNEANSRCQELGYDGLAVVITLEQRDLVYDILSKESLASEVWLAYEYHPVRLEWGWKRGGVWLNKTSQYSPEWFEGEPNFLYSQRCVRILYYHSVQWRSTLCTDRNHALCQKMELSLRYREARMKVYQTNRKEPNGTKVYDVKSVIRCLLLCLDRCTCKFTYHYGNTCYVITGNNDKVDNSSELGMYYRKV